MTLQQVELAQVYERDLQLKQEDIGVVTEWTKKQAHLAETQISEQQLVVFLHSCYYSIEGAKMALENYFTIKTHCPDLFEILSPDLLKQTLSMGFIHFLSNKTPENYAVLFCKLIDHKSENFHLDNLVRALNMILMLHLYAHGYDSGVVVVLDVEGFSLSHLLRINLMMMRKILFFVQEGLPVRLKSIHVINVVPAIEKLLAMSKPFLKDELYNMLHFHTSIDNLYEYVPKKRLPKDYGGEIASITSLNETCIQTCLENYEFFTWHNAQKVDEGKRLEKPKELNTIFGMEGSFKKLDLD